MLRAFRNRRDAGAQLAARLSRFVSDPNVIVLALPRGGVPVAFPVALALDAPLDVFVVRKLGVPGHEELAMGAIASGGVRVLNEDVVRELRISPETIAGVAEGEQRELQRRERSYRGERSLLDVRGRTVILVDDGLATGSTMRAAIAALRRKDPARIVVAVPVGSAETCAEFQDEADETVCARTPEPFYAVGRWYEDFTQTTDDEVHELMQRAAEEQTAESPYGWVQ